MHVVSRLYGKKEKKEIVRGVNSQSLCGDPGAKVVSVIMERVGSDKTGPALTKRILSFYRGFCSVHLIRLISSAGTHPSRKWSVRVNDEELRGMFEAPSVLCASFKEPCSPRWYAISRAHFPGVSPRQTTKSERQKER